MGSNKKTTTLALFLFICLNLILFAYSSTSSTSSAGKVDDCGESTKGGGRDKEGGGGKCEGRCPKQGCGGGGGGGSGGGGSSGGGTGLKKCPKDTLKLGVCADLLKHLLKVKIGEPPVKPCCSLIGDLADLEAAVCLCTAIKADLLGIALDIPVSLSLVLNACGKKVPASFRCPA